MPTYQHTCSCVAKYRMSDTDPSSQLSPFELTVLKKRESRKHPLRAPPMARAHRNTGKHFAERKAPASPEEPTSKPRLAVGKRRNSVSQS